MIITHKRNTPIPFAVTSDGRMVDVSAVDSGLIEVPDDDVKICEVEALAISESLHVISGGTQVILCSHIPVGAAKMAIKDRQSIRHNSLGK